MFPLSLKLTYSASAFRICVDEVNGHYIAGRVASQRLKYPVPFSDINQLLYLMDTVMDSQQFPMAFQEIRSFSEENTSLFLQTVPVILSAEEMVSEESIAALHGKKATFLLTITMRRNASWQGFIDWMDETPRQPFESTLAFLNALALHTPLWLQDGQR